MFIFVEEFRFSHATLKISLLEFLKEVSKKVPLKNIFLQPKTSEINHSSTLCFSLSEVFIEFEMENKMHVIYEFRGLFKQGYFSQILGILSKTGLTLPKSNCQRLNGH
jgi:hypothetical protein